MLPISVKCLQRESKLFWKCNIKENNYNFYIVSIKPPEINFGKKLTSLREKKFKKENEYLNLEIRSHTWTTLTY